MTRLFSFFCTFSLLAACCPGEAAAQGASALRALQINAGAAYNLYRPLPVPAPAYRSAPAAGASLLAASERFLGLPYVLGALGEGETGEFDRGPLVSYAGLDCTTFVEQTLAFALGGEAGALDLLRRIRYRGGDISYQARNHFAETDWLPNNIAAGFLRDITFEVYGRAAVARKTISKRAWYKGKTEAELQGFEAEAPAQRLQRLERLRALGEALPDEEAAVPYVPLAQLPSVLARIPSGTIVSVVRESRADKPTLITHQLFIFDGPAGKMVRHAAQGRQVLDVPAADYIATLSTYTAWKVLGFNLAQALP